MEQRLIDANALRAKCNAPHWCVWMSEIDDEPTVDAVPVVRCGECLRGEAHLKRNGEVYFYRCSFFDIEVEPQDFCSYGERR